MSRDRKTLVSETHARGIRRANLTALEEQRAKVLAGVKATIGRGKQSRSAIYRRTIRQIRELAGPFGAPVETGIGKGRKFLMTMLTPRPGVGLVSELLVVSFRAPLKIWDSDGPLVIRQHALERLHHRLGLVGDYNVWAREFGPTLRIALLLSVQRYWTESQSRDCILPTLNGALLGVYEDDAFVGCTWIHKVDLVLGQRVELERLRLITEKALARLLPQPQAGESQGRANGMSTRLPSS